MVSGLDREVHYIWCQEALGAEVLTGLSETSHDLLEIVDESE